jgi:hypothetical protein
MVLEVDGLLQQLAGQLHEGVEQAVRAANYSSSLGLSEALARLLLQRVALVGACRVQGLAGSNSSVMAATGGCADARALPATSCDG